MKIIEPIKNLGNLSTNNAPIDQLDTWEPTGRDLLAYLENPIFDIVGNTMVIASSTNGGIIYSVDLVSGVVTDTGRTINHRIMNLDLSPNELYVYVIFNDSNISGLNSEIFDRVGGAVRYASGVTTNSSSNAIAVINNSYWLSDSSKCAFVAGPDFYLVNSATWLPSVTNVAATQAQICMAFDGSSFYVGGRGSITKLNLAGSITNSRASDPGEDSFDSIFYNPATTDLLSINTAGKFQTVSKSSLERSAAPAQIQADVFYGFFGAKSIKVTATHLITRSVSSSPYWNYHLLSDYSLTNPLPALAEPGQGIAEATDYTIIQQSNGIALLDDLYAPITQTNPSVVAGDSYIYLDKVYEVLIDNNDQPDEGALLPVPSWLDAGFINPLRLFDGKLDSLTVAPAQLIVDITPAKVVTGIALFNIDAAWIRVTMTDPVEGLVFDTGEVSMIDNSTINDWWAFYFSPYIEKSDFVSLSLPPYADATIQVTIDGEGGAVAVGEIVVGRAFSIGITQFGSGVGILDFSEKEQDQFGNFNILERKFSKRAEYDVKIPTNQVSGAQRTLSKFRTTPIVWVGDVNREETIIYGYYKSFDIVLSNPALSDTAITVEGL